MINILSMIIDRVKTLHINNDRDMGIYLHIPFCKTKCAYCDFAAYQNLHSYYDDYVNALCEEIKLWVQKYPESTKRKVTSIYFGGGTPTELSIEQLHRILNVICNQFSIEEPEISLEGNPGEIGADYLKALKVLGINRLSFGVQTFDDHLLTLINRSHTAAEAKKTLQMASDFGFANINMDLIYALPSQTVSDLETDLAVVNKLPINHISIYGLQLEEGTYLQQLVKTGRLILPDEDTTEKMYDLMTSMLPSMGYERYEISNFAKNKAYSKHNLKYWEYCDYLGFGASAHTLYDNVRHDNLPYVVPYIDKIRNHELPTDETVVIDMERAIEDYCFLGLRTKWGIDRNLFQQKFSRSLDSIYHDVINKLEGEHLIIDDYQSKQIYLTPLGIKHGNYVFEKFLRD